MFTSVIILILFVATLCFANARALARRSASAENLQPIHIGNDSDPARRRARR